MVTINLIAIAFASMSVGQFTSVIVATDPSEARMWQRVVVALCCMVGGVATAMAAVISWAGGEWVGMVAP